MMGTVKDDGNTEYERGGIGEEGSNLGVHPIVAVNFCDAQYAAEQVRTDVLPSAG